MRHLRKLAVAIALCFLPQLALSTSACPFCRPVKTTFAQDINAADVSCLAELIHRPKRPDPGEGDIPAADIIDSYKAKFRVIKIYRGAEHLTKGQEIIAIYTGDARKGARFLLRGARTDDMQWAPPILLSIRAQQYVENILQLPATGPDRLKFFEDYLEDLDETLRNDAFDEFARADYADLIAIKDDIDHDRLLQWIRSPHVTASSRRLYFSMLGVCGQPDDAELLREMIVSGDKSQMRGLDSLIACYLTLAGPDGMPLVEDQFLRGGVFWDPEYVHTYAAIMALRFHGQEGSIIPRQRLIAAMRIMLDRPQLSDLVIPDLARWEDWESMDRMVLMFKEADKRARWVRVPIVNFLRACPLPEAKEHLTTLAEIDPQAIRRASTFFPFAGGSRTAPTDDSSSQGKNADTKSSTEATSTEVPNTEAADEEKSSDSDPADESKAAGIGTPEATPAIAGDAAEETTEDPAEVAVPLLSGIFAATVLPLLAAATLFFLMWIVLRLPRQITGRPAA